MLVGVDHSHKPAAGSSVGQVFPKSPALPEPHLGGNTMSEHPASTEDQLAQILTEIEELKNVVSKLCFMFMAEWEPSEYEEPPGQPTTYITYKPKEINDLRIKRHDSDEAMQVWRRAREWYMNSSVWKEKRKERLALDDNRCVDCGATEKLMAHHLTYVRIGQEEMDDLITLCKYCHPKRPKSKETC